jgi:UDP-N-acetylglucosamine--N-acetylmuramyl-(pentapeptide) pyrophosphoryl-undecaprenol N-acetylglucosamine transferase
MHKPPKLCLACSGGGHLRQILLLKSVYQDLDHFFVTQRTPLAESASKEHRVHYVPDVALGLLNRSPRAWWAYLRNFGRSLSALISERPDIILSTGAGAALNTFVLGRLLGARTIFVETFAHTKTPSLTGRLVSPLAHLHLVQWPALAARFPRAKVISPLVETGQTVPKKNEKIHQVLITVGTHGPFDRLLHEVERLCLEGTITGPIVAQVGPGGYQSTALHCFESCNQTEMEQLLQQSHLLITHAGTGSILSGLKAGCKVIAIARQARFGEHYDDHQLEILDEMQKRGAILGGTDPSLLASLLSQVPAFEPREVVVSTVGIEAEIQRQIVEWSGNKTQPEGN